MSKIISQDGHKRFDWPLTGKLRTDVDPMLIGETNFRSLINMRYKADCPKGILGMTKINTIPLGQSSTVINNGFLFKKDQPEMSHIFVQGTDSEGVSTLYKSNNTALIPNQDTFSTFINPLSNNNVLYFSDAPQGSMVAMNGSTNYIWSGGEHRCAKFIVYDPSGTAWFDYTEVIENTLSDSTNVATMHCTGGDYSSVILLLHFDNTFIDNSSYAHTWTITGDISFSNSEYVFGGYSANFGDGGQLSYNNTPEFNFNDGTWTIEGRFRLYGEPSEVPLTIFSWKDLSNNSMIITINQDGEVCLASFNNSTSTSISLTAVGGIIYPAIWYYISVEQNGDNYYIYVGPTSGEAVLVGYLFSAFRIPVINAPLYIMGMNQSPAFFCYIDEYRISNISVHEGLPFCVPIEPYPNNGSISACYALVASTRMLCGVKIYVGNSNTSVSTTTGFTWDGAKWATLSNISDGTSIGGITLAQTGEITFDSTLGISSLKSIRNTVAYFYQFVFTNINPATTVYHATVDAPVQPVLDIWDGTPRTVEQFFMYGNPLNTYTDYTTNIYKNDYYYDNPTTYAGIGGLPVTCFLYIGLFEKQMGMFIDMPDAKYTNSDFASILIDYWNGADWTSVGPIDDGTTTNSCSFNHAGFITWNAIPYNQEFTTTIANNIPLYYYRIHFTGVLSLGIENVRVNFITGVTAPIYIRPYRFGLKWQNRLWLCNDQSDYKNRIMCSVYDTDCNFNGPGSNCLIFGDDKALVAGSSLFSRFGSNLYDNMILFKTDSTWLVDGTSYDGNYPWTIYRISNNIGCIAPLTLQKCDVSYEVGAGLTKHILVWRSSRGIEFFDGNSIVEISDDISNLFDPASIDYIDPHIYDVANESSYYDEVNYDYHWMFVNVFGNREFAYSLKYKKWYEVQRGNGSVLSCGFYVLDLNGSIYNYGGTYTGYIERLNNGTTFDGNPITCSLWSGDVLLVKSGNYVTKLRNLKIFARSKNSDALVTVTHYADAENTGTELQTISQQNINNRLYQAKCPVNMDAVLHGLRYSITTDDENSGFEPFLVSGLFIVVREDI